MPMWWRQCNNGEPRWVIILYRGGKMSRDEVLRVLRSHRRELDELGVENVAIFGSVAREDTTGDSDIDLLVEFNRRIGLLHFVRVQRYFETLLGCTVDLVTRDALHPALRDRILEEAVDVA